MVLGPFQELLKIKNKERMRSLKSFPPGASKGNRYRLVCVAMQDDRIHFCPNFKFFGAFLQQAQLLVHLINSLFKMHNIGSDRLGVVSHSSCVNGLFASMRRA